MRVADDTSRIDAVLSRLDRVRPSGKGWVAVCPAHDDSSPSLSVSEGRVGIVFYCHAGCSANLVREKLGLEWAQLFYEGSSLRANLKRKIDRRGMMIEAGMCADRLMEEPQVLARARAQRGWAKPALALLDVGWDGERFTLPVFDKDGEPHDVLRYDPYIRRFKMLASAGASRQPWPRPEAVSTRLRSRGLFLVEGEGTAISLTSIGLPVVALPGGVQRATGSTVFPGGFQGVGWHRSWAQRFVGQGFQRIWLFPDNDDTGYSLMHAAEYDLQKAGARPVIVQLGGMEDGDGFDLGDLLAPATTTALRRQGRTLVQMLADVASNHPEQLREARKTLLDWHRHLRKPQPAKEFVPFSWEN